jgi:hypothetical protein
VRTDPRGQRLWLANITGSGEARAPAYRPTEVIGRELSRPVWLSRGDRHVVIAVDGTLQSVRPDGVVRPVSMATEFGPVTAVSVAPDGRRVALIGAGQVYVASARLDGDVLTIGDAYRRLVTGLATAVGVGWTREDRILVGGTATQGSPMVELSVDGTRRTFIERANLANLKITQLVAYPDNPVLSGDRILAMFEANGQAYDVYGQGVGPVQPTESTPGPSASATPGTTEAERSPVARAPFFRE